MGSKKKSSTSSVSQYSPPEWLKPELLHATGEARRLYESPVGTEFFPELTYVPYGPTSLAALQQMEARAGAPSPMLGALEDEATRTLQGQYLTAGTNPYLGGLFDIGASDIGAAMASQFGRGNRAGSGAHARALSQGYENLATRLYGGAYDQERAQMRQMAALAPSIYQAGFAPSQQLMRVGGLREEEQARALQDQMARFEFEQTYPYAKYDAYLNPLLGIGGLGYGTRTGQQVTRQGGGGGGFGGAMGGAMTGASVGSAAGPWGAAGGAILGGLLGAFG